MAKRNSKKKKTSSSKSSASSISERQDKMRGLIVIVGIAALLFLSLITLGIFLSSIANQPQSETDETEQTDKTSSSELEGEDSKESDKENQKAESKENKQTKKPEKESVALNDQKESNIDAAKKEQQDKPSVSGTSTETITNPEPVEKVETKEPKLEEKEAVKAPVKPETKKPDAETSKAQDKEVAAPKPKAEPTSTSKFKITAKQGDSVSKLSRKAMYKFFKQSDPHKGLSAAKRLYFEVKLTQLSNPAPLQVGSSRTFDVSTMNDLYQQARGLSGSELAAWTHQANISGYI